MTAAAYTSADQYRLSSTYISGGGRDPSGATTGKAGAARIVSGPVTPPARGR
jgi:hypothetical protein